MNNAMTPFLEALGTHLGRRLTIGAEGTLELRFADDAVVTIECMTDELIHLYAVLGPSPQDPVVMRALLVSHFFGQDTGQACLAVDPSSDELLLMRTIELSRWAPHEMPQLMDDFVMLSLHWQNRLPNLGVSLKNSEHTPSDADSIPAAERFDTGFTHLRV
jgi:Tir chaperone protein (CesT) family